MRRADVIVIGAGVMGAAAARALAQRGRDVVLIERFEVGHARGSSHGSARIWRHAYDDPRYVRMMDQALPLWRALEDEAGAHLLSDIGVLNAGAGLEVIAAAMTEAGAPFEWLDAAGARERFPMVACEGRALFDPLGGVVAADATWRALIDSALAHGVRLVDHTVATLRENDNGVTIATHRENDNGVTAGEWRAPVAIVTAGAWIRELADVPVRVTRETVAYYEADVSGLPVVVEWGAPAVYGLPMPDGTIKAAAHIAGPTADPNESGAPSEDALRADDAWIAKRFPWLAPRRVRAETCLYTNTADGHFILSRRGNVVIGSPCSGHGFKFAPLIGARLADLATA